MAEIRDGSRNSGDSGALSLYHYTGTSRTSILVKRFRWDTLFGQTTRIYIEDNVLDASYFSYLCDIPFTIVSTCIEKHSLVYVTLEYNFTHKGRIALRYKTLRRKRMNDVSIMSLVLEYSFSFSQKIYIKRQGYYSMWIT